MIRFYQSYCDNNIRIFDEPVDEYKLLCTRHIIGDGMLQKSQRQQIVIAGYISYYARKYSNDRLQTDRRLVPTNIRINRYVQP